MPAQAIGLTWLTYSGRGPIPAVDCPRNESHEGALVTDTYQPQGAHLVGSINAPDAETAMRAAAGLLGEHLRRIPDGAVGVRANWIQFQLKALAGADGVRSEAHTYELQSLLRSTYVGHCL